MFGVGEALVVAEVEVGLGAVLGDEHLAVLVGRHRPGVDVDVRVELLQLDVEARATTSSRPIDAAAIPLPSDDTTPPVMKMNRVVPSLSSCTLILSGSGRSASVQSRGATPARATDGRLGGARPGDAARTGLRHAHRESLAPSQTPLRRGSTGTPAIALSAI